ncbi:hypothetical protein BDV37DRAFT_263599 [Aspergillus pseudonomiae]|uniref:Uncharacterized protein n=1 Tax=Aspergillus pseudonomiae TaxID=1506151 RepID=A0A5N7CVW6_9EURO|nr:uncharacterized protein BDV37DRAFT_263599 [Aspergillus pseudonomiae]KAE8398355.1 hypothetical protein BDV37DRAFT_263599 [Aspergillus pseudonomiae]
MTSTLFHIFLPSLFSFWPRRTIGLSNLCLNTMLQELRVVLSLSHPQSITHTLIRLLLSSRFSMRGSYVLYY